MRFKMEIDTANAAFDDGLMGHELGLCLSRVQARLELGEQQGRVRDTYGNAVGTWKIEEVVRFDQIAIR